MTELVRGANFERLFEEFEHTAWRWECQLSYCEPEEAEAYGRFLAGEEPDMSFTREHLAEVRRATRYGRRYQRVRVLSHPLTDYLRFEMWAARANVAAGEQIRVLDLDQVEDLGLPRHDFWLFDESLVAILHFDTDGMIAAELLREAQAVNQHRRWRDIAWSYAAPFAEVLTS